MSKTKFGPRVRGEFHLPAFDDIVETNTYQKKGSSTVTKTTYKSGVLVGSREGTVMHDVVTRDFRKRQSRGEIILNPMLQETEWAAVGQSFSGVFNEDYYTGTVNSTTPSAGTTLSNIWSYSNVYEVDPRPSYPKPNLESLEAMEIQAVNDAYATSHQRDVMGFVDLAEMGKTSDFIRTQLGRLEDIQRRGLRKHLTTNSVSGLSRKRGLAKNKHVMTYRPKTALGYASDSAGLWLETQYGLLPLMGSIEGLVKALTSEASGLGQRHTFRGSDRVQYTDQVSVTTNAPGNYGAIIPVTRTTKVDVSAYARAGVITNYRPGLSGRLGLEARDLIPMGYELIPYSFVLDWAFDLGTYLEAMTPVKGFTSLGSWVTVYKEVISTYLFARPTVTSSSSTVHRRAVYNAASWDVTYGRRTRERKPGVVPQLPHFDSVFKSTNHLISGVSLALSRACGTKALSKHLSRR